jgi:hypothetical protein
LVADCLRDETAAVGKTNKRKARERAAQEARTKVWEEAQSKAWEEAASAKRAAVLAGEQQREAEARAAEARKSAAATETAAAGKREVATTEADGEREVATEEAAKAEAGAEPPDALMCPIGMELMIEPCVLADGHTYVEGRCCCCCCCYPAVPLSCWLRPPPRL